MQKYKKILIILIVLTTSIISISTISLAAKYTPGKFGDAISSTDVNAGEIKDIGGQILGIIRVVGTIVAVGMLMIIGIKYMIGSAEEKAAYKKSLLPYIIGAILIFAASRLADLIYGWAINI